MECGSLFHIRCSVGQASTPRSTWRCDKCQQMGNSGTRYQTAPPKPDGPEPTRYHQALSSKKGPKNPSLPTPLTQNRVPSLPDQHQNDLASISLSPSLQILPPLPSSLMDTSISSPLPEPNARDSNSSDSIASKSPPDGLPNGTALSGDSRKKVPSNGQSEEKHRDH